MDLADIFRKELQNLHNQVLDKNYKKRSLLSRKESMMSNRRETRNNLLFNKRNIDQNMSPFITPQNKKAVTIKSKPLNEKVSKQLDLLKKWKEKKNKQKEEAKKKSKPIFKVCHVNTAIGLPNLENVNKEIKGKIIKNISKPNTSSFAPANHKFNPPMNVKPIQFIKSAPKVIKPVVRTEKSVKNTLQKQKIESNKSQLKTKTRFNVQPSTSKENDSSVSHQELKLRNKPTTLSQSNKKANVSTLSVNKDHKKENQSNRVAKSKTVGWEQSSPSTEEQSVNSRKKYQKTPIKKLKSSNIKKTPASVNSSTVKKTKNNVSVEVKNDVNVNDVFDNDEEKVIIYDDEEITLKTPIKKLRKSQISSIRKSLRNVQETCTSLIDEEAEKPQISDRGNKSTKKDEVTPKAKILSEKTSNGEAPVYISPFVTISRGKDSARKEFNRRKSRGGTLLTSPDGKDFSESTSPQAGAEYFERILDNHIARIESKCATWKNYQRENDLPEEASDMINVTTGQSNLLITKKFEQFRGLILQCKNLRFDENTITCEDLHGFWDMLYQQVEDLNKRFDNLERLRSNGWEEVLPVKKEAPKRGRGRPKKTAASSTIREMIKAARERMNEPKTPESHKTPEYAIGSGKKTCRMSLWRQSIVRRESSPGLTMMKITQAIKSGDGYTPSKSILKSDSTKSVTKHNKSVLFFDEVDEVKKINEIINNKENQSTPLRRSRRLSKLS